VLSGHDIVQLYNYAEIIESNMKFVKNGKNYHIKFEYIFDNIDAAKKNIREIYGEIDEEFVDIYYISNNGRKMKI